MTQGTASSNPHKVTVIGAGLAGCEAALQLAARGIEVDLVEMRPESQTAVHRTADPCELVCSNSLKSLDPTTAAGCLKYELSALGSAVLACAFEARVPAGGALAVDRRRFSANVSRALEDNPHIHLLRQRVTSLDRWRASGDAVIVATGPLTDDALADDIAQMLGHDSLAFYDAAAPIVTADSLDRTVLFSQSRYGKGETSDYLNAPFSREEYDMFIDALLGAERVIMRDFETRELFSACQPIEEVARSGRDALRYGALKPVGLTDPRTGKRPWAVVQLRAENSPATAYNLVGFQTNLTFSEQKRVFSLVPGLANAEFTRFGVMHRNTFVDTPHTLDAALAVPAHRNIRFAGQISGTEGYLEAVASGLFAALATYADCRELPAPQLPTDSVFGSLLAYATSHQTQDYQPMHVNYGIINPLRTRVRNKRERYRQYALRSRSAIDAFVAARWDLAWVPYKGAALPPIPDGEPAKGAGR